MTKKTVKVIKETEKTVTVQYQEGSIKKLVTIPVEEVKGDSVEVKALTMGIIDSVDLNAINWDYVKVELNNILVSRGLTSIEAIQHRMSEFNSAVLAVVGKPLLRLYQDKEGV